MSPLANEVISTFDLLSEPEQCLVFELMQRLIPDDVATPEDLVAHAQAMQDLERGETVGFDDIDWD